MKRILLISGASALLALVVTAGVLGLQTINAQDGGSYDLNIKFLGNDELKEHTKVEVNGQECSNSCVIEGLSGEVTLSTTNTDPDVSFDSWFNNNRFYNGTLSGFCSDVTTTECTDEITMDDSVTVDWYYNTVDLVIDMRGDGSGSVTGGGIDCPSKCTHTYEFSGKNELERFTLTAAPDSNSSFKHWSTDSDRCFEGGGKEGDRELKTDLECDFTVGTTNKTTAAYPVFEADSSASGGSGSGDSGGGNTQNTTTGRQSDDAENDEDDTDLPKPATLSSVEVGGETVAINGDNDSSNMEDFSISQSEELTISGKTIPDGVVKLYIYSDPQQAETTADEDGEWSYTVSGLEPGDHRVETEVTDPETGETSDREEVLAFTVTGAEGSGQNPDQGKEEGSGTWLIVTTVTVVLVAIAAGVGYMWWRRRKKNRSDSEQAVEPHDQSSPDL